MQTDLSARPYAIRRSDAFYADLYSLVEAIQVVVPEGAALKFGHTATLASLACTGVFAEAMAQDAGAMLKGPDTQLKFGLDLRHDSNAARSSEALAIARGLRQADQRISPIIELSLRRPIGAGSITADLQGGYDFYRFNKRLQRERLQAALGADLQFGTCSLDPNFEYSRRQSELGEIGALPGGGTTSVRNAEDAVDISAGIDCGSAIGFRPFVSGAFQRARNSAQRRKVIDHDTGTLRGGVAYNHPVIGKVALTASYADTTFDRQVLLDGRKNGYGLTTAGLKFERTLVSSLQLMAEVSYAKVDARNSTTAEFKGINWGVELTANPALRLQGRLFASRKVISTLAVAALYHVDTTWGAQLNYAVGERLTLKALGSVKTRRMFGAQALFGPVLTDDNLKSADLTATYKLNPRLSLIGLGRYERRQANDAFYNYDNATVQLGFRLRL